MIKGEFVVVGKDTKLHTGLVKINFMHKKIYCNKIIKKKLPEILFEKYNPIHQQYSDCEVHDRHLNSCRD